MAVKMDNLSDIEKVESLKGLCMSYLEDGMYVCACVLHLRLYMCVSTWWLCVCVYTHIHTNHPPGTTSQKH